jgi:hypothetical protein
MLKNLNQVFTFVYGAIPERVAYCLKQNEIICRSFQVPFRIINFDMKNYHDHSSIGIVSDYLRLKYASENSRVLYVDWDIELLKFPDFNAECPAFAQIARDCPGFKENLDTYDFYIFYNGNKTKYFKDFLDFCGPTQGVQHTPYYTKFNDFWKNKKFSALADGTGLYHHYGLKLWDRKE